MLERPKTAGKVYLLPVEQIEPSPHQARRTFDEKELARFAGSILEHGLLQPVAVIPALLCEADEQGAAALGLVENLQRQPLDPFEQARGIREMIALWDCTQEEAARHLGMAQPTLANKLRLLALTEAQQKFVTANGLTERHARAVLRLPEAARTPALEQMAAKGLNARQADELVAGLLAAPPKKRRPRRRIMVRDVRVFVNTIDRAVRLMVDAGVPAETTRTDGDGFIEYRVRIPASAALAMSGAGEKTPG